ncbi:MAG: hypothetical protein LBL62_11375 [Planctomycetaceae bacterium]|nr:hypothetical protein [Planctomycetaceae bacterium]
MLYVKMGRGGGATEDIPITSGLAEERLPQIISAIAVSIVVLINPTVTITSIIPFRNLYWRICGSF